jgi:hypothetical protein
VTILKKELLEILVPDTFLGKFGDTSQICMPLYQMHSYDISKANSLFQRLVEVEEKLAEIMKSHPM